MDDYAKRAEEKIKEVYHRAIEGPCLLDSELMCSVAFKAGVQWARENPPPEVLALVEALKTCQKYVHDRSCMEHEVCATSHSMECDEAREALRRLEGRG